MNITDYCEVQLAKRQTNFLFVLIKTTKDAKNGDAININKLIGSCSFEILFVTQDPKSSEFDPPSWNSQTVFLGSPPVGERTLVIIGVGIGGGVND